MRGSINGWATRAGSPDTLAAVSSRMLSRNALAPEPPRAIRSHPEFVRIFLPLFSPFLALFKTECKMPALMCDTTHSCLTCLIRCVTIHVQFEGNWACSVLKKSQITCNVRLDLLHHPTLRCSALWRTAANFDTLQRTGVHVLSSLFPIYTFDPF